ncbi:hypothetical protein [Bartonella choladocola]|uniref:Uncharacterized protein n=1 Tax=Bartonella choladocola TaxID=2750995 RepID=A0A1U9MJQ4_9HYPH|nr:hypothetical protein [Bartonella choladocola]AQT47968.1 hypothetical protein BBC0122_018730 [Bartonella choladocola]
MFSNLHSRKFGADLVDQATEAYLGGISDSEYWDEIDENGDVVPVFADDPWSDFDELIDQILHDDEALSYIGSRNRNDVLNYFSKNH